MATLRQVGLLGAVIEMKEGLVVWPAVPNVESACVSNYNGDGKGE